MIKTYSKIALKLFRKHFSRMISIIFIVLISVAFVSGVGSSSDKIYASATWQYKNQNMSDFIVKSTSLTGFSNEQINSYKEKFSSYNIETLTTYDIENNGIVSRLYFKDFENSNINKIKILEGKFPSSFNECMVERGTNNLKYYKIGDKISIQNQEYEVVGICLNPLILNTVEEIGFVGGEERVIDQVIYFNNENLPKTDIWISIENRDIFNGFSSNYKEFIDKTKLEIKSLNSGVEILTLYQNKGLYAMVSYADKVEIINYVLMIAFILVAMLIVLSTMTRLVEEERGQIACLTTLGYAPFKIIKKYLIFALVSMSIGSFIGYFVGEFVCKLIYDAFNARFYMSPMSGAVSLDFFLLVVLLMAVSLIFITLYVGLKTANETPSSLLQYKSPPNGKKVILERIPFFQSSLSRSFIN